MDNPGSFSLRAVMLLWGFPTVLGALLSSLGCAEVAVVGLRVMDYKAFPYFQHTTSYIYITQDDEHQV